MRKCYEKKSIRLLEFLGSLSCSSTGWSRGACCFDDLLTKYCALDTDRDASVCLLETSVADVCIFFPAIFGFTREVRMYHVIPHKKQIVYQQSVRRRVRNLVTREFLEFYLMMR